MSNMSSPATQAAETPADVPESVSIPVPSDLATPAKTAETVESVPPPETAETPKVEAKPEAETEGEKRRRERNQQRWRQMKAASDEVTRLRSELALVRANQRDLNELTDPDDILAEKAASRIRADQETQGKSRLEQAERAQVQALYDAWDQVKADARERMPDFDSVVTSQTPIHEAAAPYIVESDKGAEIAYYLGKNPDEARNLFAMFNTNRSRAYAELGKIEAKVSAPAKSQPTKAPAPPPILTGGSNPIAPDPYKGSVDDMASYLRSKGLVR